MASASSQPVLAPTTSAAMFLVATIDDGGEAAVHDALQSLSGLVRAVGARNPAARLSLVTGVGSDAWDRLFTGPRPAQLHARPVPEVAFLIEAAGQRSPRPQRSETLLSILAQLEARDRRGAAG